MGDTAYWAPPGATDWNEVRRAADRAAARTGGRVWAHAHALGADCADDCLIFYPPTVTVWEVPHAPQPG